MDLDQIYILGNAFSRGALHVEPEGDLRADDIFSTNRNYQQKLSFKRQSGTRAYDLVGMTCAGCHLFSKRSIDLFQANNFSGWRVEPVSLSGKDNEAISDYYALFVTGFCGRLDNSLSIKKTRKTKSGKGSIDVWVGLYFDVESWDGSDMFTPEGTQHTFVTERVKNLIEGHKLSNIHFERITEVENLMLV
jgi:hypothetical protein